MEVIVHSGVLNSANNFTYAFLNEDNILIFDSLVDPDVLAAGWYLSFPTKEQSNNAVKTNKSTQKQYAVAACMSNCNNFFAACDSFSLLHLWKKSEETGHWNELSSRELPRKGQKAIFSNSGSEIIIADRGGNVTSFSATSHDSPGKFLLGHISLIIDLSISHDDKYLVTCDRDGKIRVSCYPNCYNIQSYCLGHQEFVSFVKCISLYDEFVLSSSGDGTIRLWNYFDGTQAKCVKIFEDAELIKECISCDNANLEFFENSGNIAITVEQFRFSIRCLKFCFRYKLFAILFYMQNGIAIYQLPNAAEENFRFIQFISLKSEAADVVFDALGNLLILQQCKDEVTLFFEYKENEKKYLFNNDYNKDLVFNMKAFYGDGEYFMDAKKDFEHLFKSSYEFSDDT
ncbi:tRNA (guanine-N(7)-)-methyltransferase subunit WDR4, partial [Stegodyphus mimosarum]